MRTLKTVPVWVDTCSSVPNTSSTLSTRSRSLTPYFHSKLRIEVSNRFVVRKPTQVLFSVFTCVHTAVPPTADAITRSASTTALLLKLNVRYTPVLPGPSETLGSNCPLYPHQPMSEALMPTSALKLPTAYAVLNVAFVVAAVKFASVIGVPSCWKRFAILLVGAA